MLKNLFRPELVLVALVILAAAAPHYHSSRARVRCSLPPRAYIDHSVSALAVAVSDQAERLSRSKTAYEPSPVAIKVLQFRDPAFLQVDHCSISNIVLTLYADGRWEIALEANQNPVASEPLLTIPMTRTEEKAALYTEHLLRSKFVVRLDCWALAAEPPLKSHLGKPVVATLIPDGFWVQRGVPLTHVAKGFSTDVRERFDLIDRARLEFHYERAPYQETASP